MSAATKKRSPRGGPYHVTERTWWYRNPDGSRTLVHEERTDGGTYLSTRQWRITEKQIREEA